MPHKEKEIVENGGHISMDNNEEEKTPLLPNRGTKTVGGKSKLFVRPRPLMCPHVFGNLKQRRNNPRIRIYLKRLTWGVKNDSETSACRRG